MNKLNIVIGISIALMAFTIGWLFPVEGPFDSTYEDYQSYKKVKHSRGVAKARTPIMCVVTEEEIEEYYKMLNEAD